MKYMHFFTRFLLTAAAVGAWQFSADANLVRNGAFAEPGTVTTPQPPISRPDNRVPSWRMRAEWHVDLEANSPLKGAQVLKATGGNINHDLTQNVYLEPGKRYTLSAWVKGKDLVNISDNRSDLQAGVFVTDWRWTMKFPLELHDVNANEWQRYESSFIAPPATLVGGVEQPCIVRVFLPKGETGTLWVSGIQIEEGEKAGEFAFITTPQRQEASSRVSRLLGELESVETNAGDFEGAAKGQLAKSFEGLRVRLTALSRRLEAGAANTTAAWVAVEKELNALEESAKQYLQPFGWWANAWQNLPIRALPEDIAKTQERSIKIVRAVNDYGALLLPVANLTRATIPVEVKLGDTVAPLSTQSTFEGPIKVSTSYWVSNEGYRSTISPVKEHQSFPYYLQPLPASNTTVLPAQETTQLWFDVDTRGMKPGTYSYKVTLIGLNRDFTWEGSVELTVLPVVLPEEVPNTVMAFFNMPVFMQPFSPHSADAPILNFTPEERLKIARPWLQLWKEMGFNRMMLTNQFIKYEFDEDGKLAAPVDYSLFDAYHALFSEVGDKFWAGYNLGAYHVYRSHRDLSKVKFNRVSRNRTESIMKSFTDHARSLGLTPESMPICLFDEPHGKRIDITRQGKEALEKVASGWKLIAAIAGTDREHVKPLLPLLDIFAVRQRMGQMDMKPETIKYLKENGKEVWGYACSGSFEYLHPYRYFRMLPWQAWSNGLGGYGLYMTIGHDTYPTLSARSSYFSPIFLGRDGPVLGRGARGFQQGSRDWTLFTLAKAELARRKEAKRDSKKLEKLLTQSLKHVVEEEDDASLADDVREQLLQELHSSGNL